MKPYGLIKKILHNHPDNHPQKGRVNWWEKETLDKISKKSERRLARKEIFQSMG